MNNDNLTQLLASERLQHDTGVLTFPAPVEMHERMMEGIQPLVDRGFPVNVVAEMSDPTTVVARDEDVSHTAYARVLLRAEFDLGDEEHRAVAAVVYDLKSANPKVTLASGAQVQVCINQCVWGADQVVTRDLVSGGLSQITPFFKKYSERLSQEWEEFQELRRTLQERVLTREGYERVVGHLFVGTVGRRRAVQVPQASLSHAVKNIEDPRNYRYEFGEDGIDAWTLLNAITDHTSRTYLNRVYDNTLAATQAIRDITAQ